LSLVVELGILIRFGILGGRVTQFCKALLGGGAYEVGQHVVDAALRIDEVLLAFAFDLNLAAHNALDHVHRLFLIASFKPFIAFHEESLAVFDRVYFVRLFCLHLLKLNLRAVVLLVLNLQIVA